MNKNNRNLSEMCVQISSEPLGLLTITTLSKRIWLVQWPADNRDYDGTDSALCVLDVIDLGKSNPDGQLVRLV